MAKRYFVFCLLAVCWACVVAVADDTFASAPRPGACSSAREDSVSRVLRPRPCRAAGAWWPAESRVHKAGSAFPMQQTEPSCWSWRCWGHPWLLPLGRGARVAAPAPPTRRDCRLAGEPTRSGPVVVLSDRWERGRHVGGSAGDGRPRRPGGWTASFESHQKRTHTQQGGRVGK